MKTFFVITLSFTVLSCCYSATTMLRNGDIIEIESLDLNNERSGYELEKVIQTFGNKQPVTFEIVTNERVPAPYRGQMQYYNNNYNENRERPMYRPPPPPNGYANQYPPQYNPYNRPHQHHHHQQRPFDYIQQPNQNQQNGNNQFVLTKHSTNPNYPNFEVYTVDVTNTRPNQNPHINNPYPNNNNQYSNNNNQYPNTNNQYPNINNQYPNIGDDQNGNVGNLDINSNSGDKPNEYNDENKSEENIKDNVDGYIDKFPVILLKENEIRR